MPANHFSVSGSSAWSPCPGGSHSSSTIAGEPSSEPGSKSRNDQRNVRPTLRALGSVPVTQLSGIPSSVATISAEPIVPFQLAPVESVYRKARLPSDAEQDGRTL